MSKWTWRRLTKNSIALMCEDRGITDYPIQYPDGSIGYDRPERIPKHIKRKVAQAFASGEGLAE